MGRRILVIEDNREIRENTTEILELYEFETCSVSNGEEGIAALEETSPDLILCDIQLPGMNGYEILQKVRDNLKYRNLPFIFVTAYSEKSELNKGMELGANEYIVKPFDVDELIAVISRYLENEIPG